MMIHSGHKPGVHSVCRMSGLFLAISMMTAMMTVCCGAKCGGIRFTADNSAKTSSPSESSVTEITISEPSMPLWKNSEKTEKAYEKLIRENKKKDQPESIPSAPASETQSTTSSTAAVSTEVTTFITTVTSQTAPTTASVREEEEESTQSVSNGKEPFNYNDVSSVAFHLNTLGDFADEINPSMISWNAEGYAENGCVEITMDSDSGRVVLDVKSVDNAALGEESSGSLSGSDALSWNWLSANRTAGCNITTVIWKDGAFPISPVRGIGVGSSLAVLTDNYLCVNGGANTLYKASDVIDDQAKLNAILAAENLYTFVGGRVYSIGSYLDKYYSGREHTFLFEDCDYVVQYGCNSIMEHNYTTGSWIMEYAVKEDTVIGIRFMNKSYYSSRQKTPVSTVNSSSGIESAVVTTQAETTSSTDLAGENDPGENAAESENEPSGTTAADEEIPAE